MITQLKVAAPGLELGPSEPRVCAPPALLHGHSQVLRVPPRDLLPAQLFSPCKGRNVCVS